MTQAADTDIRVGQPEMVTLTIDGVEISVPKGTLVIRAAELMGIQIPRFCDHPLLEPVGACRQCLVEVEGQRKPLASCTTVATDDMVVRTQLTSEIADKAQHGVMELLLINHPLDCPMCDKGGECPLQNQAMSNGRTDSRFTEAKRTFAKPINISAQVLLDRERCILCARCTRFSDQIAGDPFIDMQERGALQQVGIYADEPFESYFSGNTVQICPVGALTGTAYRFRARPFDLVSSPSVCEHCASCTFSASVNCAATKSVASHVLISSQAPGSAWLFSGSSRSCHSMLSSRSPKTRARSLACDAPVPNCSPRTANTTAPCSSNTSRSASTPTPHAVTVVQQYRA